MIAEYGIKDMNDVHEFVKMLTAETIPATLDTELDCELDYSKYDYKNKQTTSSRNGHSTKTVQGSMGELELQSVYAKVILDAIRYNVRNNGIDAKKALPM